MATSVRVSGARFREGDLPQVCAHTGRGADRLYRLEADRIPAWMFLLVFLGVLPFLLALVFRSKPEPGWIPLSASSASLLRAYRLGMAGFGVATVLLVGLALVIRQPVALLLALLTAGGWLGSAWRSGWHSPAARETRQGDIVLENVHPRFVTAVGRVTT